MRWLDSIIDLIDMNLSKLWEIVEDREAWRATVHGGHKESDMTEQLNQTELCLYSQKTTLQNFSVEFYFELKRQHKYVTI